MKTTEQAWDLREHLPECTQVHLWNPVTRLDERTPLLQSSVMEYRYSHRNMNRKCSKTQVKELAPKTSHLKTGKKGEQIAANYLISIGYKIRGKNIRLSRDEIDILAYDPFDKVLVFAEVKTRTFYKEDILPSVNLTFSKKRKLCRSARRWIAKYKYEGGYRIDAVYIAAGKVLQHVKEIEWIDN